MILYSNLCMPLHGIIENFVLLYTEISFDIRRRIWYLQHWTVLCVWTKYVVSESVPWTNLRFRLELRTSCAIKTNVNEGTHLDCRLQLVTKVERATLVATKQQLIISRLYGHVYVFIWVQPG